MEDNKNNSTTPEEAPDMVESMRGEDDHIDIGEPDTEPTTPPTLSKGSEEFNFEYNGTKINISSSVLRADYLMNLCLGFLEEFKKDKPSKNGGGYLG